MLIGFSSALCPQWDLQTLLSEGKALGFQAIELDGLAGCTHLPECAALSDASGVVSAFQAAEIELLNLVCDGTLETRGGQAQSNNRARLRETVSLAGKLRCRYVTVKLPRVSAPQSADSALCRIIDSLLAIAPYAAEQKVGLLIENAGSFATSRDMWYLLDATGHPSVRCCWNPRQAQAAGDSLSLSVPRIGRQTAIAHILDAHFDRPLTQERMDWNLYLTLLRGIGAAPGLILTSASRDVTNPGETLASARSRLEEIMKQLELAPELTAYKGDKYAPRYAALKGKSH